MAHESTYSDADTPNPCFHFRDNWFFERIKEGNVRIYHLDAWGLVERGFVVDAASWASIVASVSKLGDNAKTYQMAIAYHQGDLSE